MLCQENPTPQSSHRLVEKPKVQRALLPRVEMENSAVVQWLRIGRYPNLEFGQHGLVRTVKGRVLRQRLMENGYLTVCIKSHTEARWFPRLVHRLIAEAFHGSSPLGRPQIRHLNGVRFDNRAENLKWGNNTENQRDRKMHGTYLDCERAPGAKLSNLQATEIRRRSDENRRDLAHEFGVTASNICYILKNRTFKMARNAISPADVL